MLTATLNKPATVAFDQDRVIDLKRQVRYVPDFVVDAITRVRRSGWRDMYDRETVMMLAATLGHGEAAEWLVERRHLYFIALRRSETTASF